MNNRFQIKNPQLADLLRDHEILQRVVMPESVFLRMNLYTRLLHELMGVKLTDSPSSGQECYGYLLRDLRRKSPGIDGVLFFPLNTVGGPSMGVDGGTANDLHDIQDIIDFSTQFGVGEWHSHALYPTGFSDRDASLVRGQMCDYAESELLPSFEVGGRRIYYSWNPVVNAKTECPVIPLALLSCPTDMGFADIPNKKDVDIVSVPELVLLRQGEPGPNLEIMVEELTEKCNVMRRNELTPLREIARDLSATELTAISDDVQERISSLHLPTLYAETSPKTTTHPYYLQPLPSTSLDRAIWSAGKGTAAHANADVGLIFLVNHPTHAEPLAGAIRKRLEPYFRHSSPAQRLAEEETRQMEGLLKEALREVPSHSNAGVIVGAFYPDGLLCITTGNGTAYALRGDGVVPLTQQTTGTRVTYADIKQYQRLLAGFDLEAFNPEQLRTGLEQFSLVGALRYYEQIRKNGDPAVLVAALTPRGSNPGTDPKLKVQPKTTEKESAVISSLVTRASTLRSDIGTYGNRIDALAEARGKVSPEQVSVSDTALAPVLPFPIPPADHGALDALLSELKDDVANLRHAARAAIWSPTPSARHTIESLIHVPDPSTNPRAAIHYDPIARLYLLAVVPKSDAADPKCAEAAHGAVTTLAGLLSTRTETGAEAIETHIAEAKRQFTATYPFPVDFGLCLMDNGQFYTYRDAGTEVMVIDRRNVVLDIPKGIFGSVHVAKTTDYRGVFIATAAVGDRLSGPALASTFADGDLAQGVSTLSTSLIGLPPAAQAEVAYFAVPFRPATELAPPELKLGSFFTEKDKRLSKAREELRAERETAKMQLAAAEAQLAQAHVAFAEERREYGERQAELLRSRAAAHEQLQQRERTYGEEKRALEQRVAAAEGVLAATRNAVSERTAAETTLTNRITELTAERDGYKSAAETATRALEEHTKTYEREVTQLGGEIASRDTRLAELNANYSARSREIDDFKRNLDGAGKTVARLEATVGEVQGKLTQAEARARAKDKRRTATQLDDLEALTAKYEDVLAKLRKEIDDLKPKAEQYDLAQGIAQRAERDLQAAQVQLSGIASRADIAERHAAELAQQLAEANQQLLGNARTRLAYALAAATARRTLEVRTAEYGEKIGKLTNEVEFRDGRLLAQEIKLDQQKGRIAELEAAAERQRAEYDHLGERFTKLQVYHGERMEEFYPLRDRFTHLEQKVSTLTKRLKKVRNFAEVTRGEREQYRDVVKAQRETLLALKQSLETAAEADRTAEQLSAYGTLVDQLRAKYVTLNERLSIALPEICKAVEGNTAQLDTLETTLTDWAAEIGKLRTDAQALQQGYDALRENQDALIADRQAALGERDAARDAAAAHKDARDELARQYHELSGEYRTAQKTLVTLAQEAAALRANLARYDALRQAFAGLGISMGEPAAVPATTTTTPPHIAPQTPPMRHVPDIVDGTVTPPHQQHPAQPAPQIIDAVVDQPNPWDEGQSIDLTTHNLYGLPTAQTLGIDRSPAPVAPQYRRELITHPDDADAVNTLLREHRYAEAEPYLIRMLGLHINSDVRPEPVLNASAAMSAFNALGVRHASAQQYALAQPFFDAAADTAKQLNPTPLWPAQNARINARAIPAQRAA